MCSLIPVQSYTSQSATLFEKTTGTLSIMFVECTLCVAYQYASAIGVNLRRNSVCFGNLLMNNIPACPPLPMGLPEVIMPEECRDKTCLGTCETGLGMGYHSVYPTSIVIIIQGQSNLKEAFEKSLETENKGSMQ